MDFYALLDQIIILLRRRGRVSYRALKLQFQLDDDHLEALKDELIKAQRLVAATGQGEILRQCWMPCKTACEARV
jgi:hypothetical protein